LADLYLSQGLYGQAIYAQEEALIIAPNAWNVSYPGGKKYASLGNPMLTIYFLYSSMLA
jgi:hypothetical protein